MVQRFCLCSSSMASPACWKSSTFWTLHRWLARRHGNGERPQVPVVVWMPLVGLKGKMQLIYELLLLCIVPYVSHCKTFHCFYALYPTFHIAKPSIAPYLQIWSNTMIQKLVFIHTNNFLSIQNIMKNQPNSPLLKKPTKQLQRDEDAQHPQFYSRFSFLSLAKQSITNRRKEDL